MTRSTGLRSHTSALLNWSGSEVMRADVASEGGAIVLVTASWEFHMRLGGIWVHILVGVAEVFISRQARADDGGANT